MIESYRGMTREQFLGDAKVIPDMEIVPEPTMGISAYPREPFMDGLEARYLPQACIVHDRGLYVGIYHYRKGSNSSLWVRPSHRRRGIAEEMIYQCCARGMFPEGLPSRTRTATLQRVLERLWERIQRELN